jgi:DNA-directed RNA polymerase specialized sigma24 family protein
MATLAQPKLPATEPQYTAAEQALWEAFEEHLDTLSPEQRKMVVADLRANAEAHGE